MRILCLNCWGGRVHGPLIGYLAECGADVLCLQEMIRSPGAAAGWRDYRDGDTVLPQRACLFDEVAAALPGHTGTFCPAARGPLWQGDREFPSLWGIATFVRRDLAVTAQVQGFVHGSFAADGYGAHPRSRNAHVLRVDDAAGRGLVIGHMHGLRDPGAGKGDTPERLAQAQRFAALAAGLAEPGDGMVLCGDFNVTPDSATFGILAGLGLRDLVTGGGFDGTRSALYQKPGRHADYMLVNPAVTVAGFDVVRAPEVSDHCPLLLEI